jgi:rfaE bifunctional protein kinase chain/domain
MVTPALTNDLEIFKSRYRGRLISFVSGNFNVIHPGHLRLLKFATEVSDAVIVGVNSDGAPGVFVPLNDRMAAVSALSFVSLAIAANDDICSLILEIKPDFVIKGSEFHGQYNVELDAVSKYGGKLIFSSGESYFQYQNVDYKKSIINFTEHKKVIDNYFRRYSFNAADLITHIRLFSKLKVVVLGDVIIDDYIQCNAVGLSQEDPSIVVAPVETRTFLGGAGIVAAHAAGLGASVSFYSVVGDDAGYELAKSELTRYGIDANIWKDRTRPTTRKQRYRAQGKTLLRVNHFRQHWIEDQLISEIFSEMKSRLDHCDVLIFSDFNYGCVPQALVDQIAEYAQQRGILMVADSQASSQMGDISRFKFMSLITPTEREARLAVRNDEVGIPHIIELLRQQSKSNNIIVTLGGDGVLISGLHNGQYTTDQIPAFNTSPLDAAGAGDSLLAASSMCLAIGINIWQSAFLGSLAAACQVGRLGNVPLRASELISELDTFT